MAVVSQLPPSDEHWQRIDMALVVRAAAAMNAHLGNPYYCERLARGVQMARNDYACSPRVPTEPGRPPGVVDYTVRAIWLDHVTFPGTTRAITGCLPMNATTIPQYWTPVGFWDTQKGPEKLPCSCAVGDRKRVVSGNLRPG